MRGLLSYVAIALALTQPVGLMETPVLQVSSGNPRAQWEMAMSSSQKRGANTRGNSCSSSSVSVPKNTAADLQVAVVSHWPLETALPTPNPLTTRVVGDPSGDTHQLPGTGTEAIPGEWVGRGSPSSWR